IIDNSKEGYISPSEIQGLLDACNIPRVSEYVARTREDAVKIALDLGFPVVMKVLGPIHKSDKDGVVLNVNDFISVEKHFDKLMQIPETTAVLIQPMLSGNELFIGAKYEPKFGHIVFCGLGGIFIEILNDYTTSFSPITKKEAYNMIKKLKGYKIFKGIRGCEGINEHIFAEIIVRLSALLEAAPEIIELDFNPLLGKTDKVVVVDARINVEK
ncbi:MAG: acetate--CoA ligase family protein, partial [Bacteroidales bacterium]|nr:acetate--CoA ligase family protein [Bacteroidales bacterium]